MLLRLGQVGAANFHRDLARIVRARATGAGMLGLSRSAKQRLDRLRHLGGVIKALFTPINNQVGLYFPFTLS